MNNNNAIHADNGNTNMMKLQARPMMIDVLRSMYVEQQYSASEQKTFNKIYPLVSVKPCSINDIAFALKVSRSAANAMVKQIEKRVCTVKRKINGSPTLIVRSIGLVMDYVPTGISVKDLECRQQ